MSYLKKTLLTSSIIGFAGIILIAVCTGYADDSDIPVVKDHSESAAEPVTERKLEGWKEARYEKFRFMIPADWKEEPGMDIWYPPSESFETGLPEISLQCGAMPVMSGQTPDEQLKELMHGNDPISKTPVNTCGMKGHIREVQGSWGVKHLALTLEENVAGGMVMVTFFNCRAPDATYNKYEDIFRKILDSVHCK
jgi:hypothetical protein